MAAARSIFKDEHELFRKTASRPSSSARSRPTTSAGRRKVRSAARCGGRRATPGLLLTDIPEEYGGAGADFLYSAVMIEEMAKRVFAAPGFRLHSDIVAPYILNYGSEEQKRAWLPRWPRAR